MKKQWSILAAAVLICGFAAGCNQPVKGNRVNLEKHTVDLKGNTVELEKNKVDMEKNRIDLESHMVEVIDEE